MTEQSDIASPLLKALRRLPYVHAIRLHSGSARGGRQRLCPPGTPDMLVVVRGCPLFIETKAPRGRLSDAQVEQTELIQAAGGMVRVVTSVRQGLAIVTGLLNGALKPAARAAERTVAG